MSFFARDIEIHQSGKGIHKIIKETVVSVCRLWIVIYMLIAETKAMSLSRKTISFLEFTWNSQRG